MKLFITGGTGFVGGALTRRLAQKGHEITILTRGNRRDQYLIQGVSFIEGDSTKKGDWQELLTDYDVIINLAGASIFRRWTKKNKKAIIDSRIFTTENLVEGLMGRKSSGALLISTSAVGYYGFHGDEELSENSPPGNDFLASVSKEWENAAKKAEKYGARVVICRLGIVLGKEGGALKQMIPLYKWYMGSRLGSGRQWFSWIHQEDLVNIYLFLIRNKDIFGPVNCTSPKPVRNKDMTEIMGRVLKRPTFMPAVPGFMIRLFMGEFGDTLIKGQRVLPEKLREAGFKFRFPELQHALEDILRENDPSDKRQGP